MQNFKDFELIIVNDCSTDQTSDLLAQYSANESITILSNDNNKGLPASLNIGLKHAKGEFIARLDDDDEWEDRDKLAKQIQCFVNRSKLVLLGTAFRTETNFVRNPILDEDIRRQMLFRCPFQHSTIMFKRVINGDPVFYNDKMGYAEDWELWLRLGTFGEMYNLDEPTCFIRTGDNLSEKNFTSQHRDNLEMIKQFQKDYPRSARAILYHKLVIMFFTFIPVDSKLHRLFQSVFKKVFFKST